MFNNVLNISLLIVSASIEFEIRKTLLTLGSYRKFGQMWILVEKRICMAI